MLLLLATHQEREWEFQGEVYRLKPGQLITSLDSIRTHCGSDVTIQKIRTTLKKLKRWGFLTDQSTNKNRLITLVNWEVYQGEQEEANKASNKQLTSNQQAPNKQSTGNQQATNRQLTTNKNVKNEKNLENGKNRRREFPYESEHEIMPQIEQHYLSRRGNGTILSARDVQAIQQIVKGDIPLTEILTGIDYAFDQFQPKHTLDRIQSFAYCSKVIRDRFARKTEFSGKGGERDKKNQSSIQKFEGEEDDPFAMDLRDSYYASVIAKECLE